jgi:broad specificity phosphatase PhoE
MTLLAVIRHGPTEWNAARKLQGMSDIPLSAEGRALVTSWKLPEEFRAWRVLSSPLMRAQETAKLLGAQTLMIEPLLREMSFGQWEGFTIKELAARNHPDEFQALADKGLDMLPPEGESPRMVIERLKVLLKRLAEEGEPTVAVCHKGIIRALLALATDWPMLGRQPVKLDWSSLHCFRLEPDGTPRLDRINVSLREIAEMAP